MILPPKTRAAIEAGRQWIAIDGRIERRNEFTARIALLAVQETTERCAEICVKWPLSARNMDRVDAWDGGWANKVAGVCRSELPKAIRAAFGIGEKG